MSPAAKWDADQRRTGKPVSKPEPRDTCTWCGKPGHWRPDCPEIAKMERQRREERR